MNKFHISVAALAIALGGTAAHAQDNGYDFRQMSRSDTTAFAGVNFVFGSGGQSVEGVVGVAYGEIDNGNDVKGAKATLHFGFLDGFSLDKVKLTGLFGSDDAQAEVGGGYSLKNGAPFVVIGANGEYLNVGADIFLDGNIDGYIGLHSIGKLEPGRTEQRVDQGSPIDFPDFPESTDG